MGERIEVSEINEKLMVLWEDHFAKEKDPMALAPLQYPKLMTEAILFVGLNPSFSDDGWEKIVEKEKEKLGPILKGLKPADYFRWPSSEAFSVEGAITLEEKSRKHYSKYFGPIKTIAENLGEEFEHIDIFAYRETNAGKTLSTVAKKKVDLNVFGRRQFDIFTELLKKLNPKVVVVNNASASHIYLTQREVGFCPRTGVFTDSIDGGRAFPVFFTAMLTGGHLDVFSRDRLYWHLSRTLGKEVPREAWSIYSNRFQSKKVRETECSFP